MKIITLPGNPKFNAGLRDYFDKHYPDHAEFVDVTAGFFASGDPKIQLQGNVRNSNVFVVQDSSGYYPSLQDGELETRLAQSVEAWSALSVLPPENRPHLNKLLFALTGIEVGAGGLDEDRLITFLANQYKNSVNDGFMSLLVTLDAVKRADATAITVVQNYFKYARQDRKDRPRVPITAKLAADLIEKASGRFFRGIITTDLHVPQIQGFFDAPVDDVPMTWLIAADIIAYLQKNNLTLDDIVLVSPDVGGHKRLEKIADELDLEKIANILNASDLSGKCGIALYKKGDRQPDGSVTSACFRITKPTTRP
jgi:ribose-phosphate pyrophosphokinase